MHIDFYTHLNNYVNHLLFLKNKKLTKINEISSFIIFIYYLFCFVFSLFIWPLSLFLKPGNVNSVNFSWSKTHSKILDSNLCNSKWVFGKVIPLKFILLGFPQLAFFKFFNFSLLKALIKNPKSFFCILVYFQEFSFVYSYTSRFSVKEINIAGHYDKYVCLFSNVCSISRVKLSVYQHGVLSSVNLPAKLKVDCVYLKYHISESKFRNIYSCTSYVYQPSLDFDRERITQSCSVDVERSVLVVGQVNNLISNLEILNWLSDNTDYNVYYLSHPSDKTSYYSPNWICLDNVISNPSLVITCFSSLGYSYHLLGFKTFFIGDNSSLDFYHDKSVKIVSDINSIKDKIKFKDNYV